MGRTKILNMAKKELELQFYWAPLEPATRESKIIFLLPEIDVGMVPSPEVHEYIEIGEGH